jgi:serine/threonine protein kinase
VAQEAGVTRETRHYTILGLIGRGGQGNVYQARLQDTGGFRKDVAIKLLKDGLDDESIQRFRDEARILGLVRDRAIVSVDPPIRLAGRWALVMELAEGLSTHLALVRGGPLPVTVALEVVTEVARVLDKLYRARGLDGQPLHLLHRDIKPANIQITHEGEVKLLDFGVARADFEERETRTVQHIGGTFGFIAPERLRGVNSPACDIFSLGVTLRVLLTGEKPATMGPATMAALTPDLYHGIELAEQMRHEDPQKRPTAQEVERKARELRAAMKGPTLQDWANHVMPKLQRPMEDPLVGTVLTESFELEPELAVTPRAAPAPPPAPKPAPSPPALAPVRRWRRVPPWVLAAAAMALVFWLSTVGVVAVASQRWFASLRQAQQVQLEQEEGLVATEPAPARPEPTPVPEPAPAPAPTPTPPAPAPPAPEVAVSAPPRPAPPRPAPPRPAAPARAATLPVQAPPAPVVTHIDLSSAVPAIVWVDGVKVGPAPLRRHPVAAGTHQIRLEASGKSVEATVLVGGRRGSTQFDWDGGPALGAR